MSYNYLNKDGLEHLVEKTKLGDFTYISDVTISSVTYHTYWKVKPTSSNQVYGVGVHPTNGKLYQIYNNKGTYSATNLDRNTTYTGATLKTATAKTGSGTTVTTTIAASTAVDTAIGTLLNNDNALSESLTNLGVKRIYLDGTTLVIESEDSE